MTNNIQSPDGFNEVDLNPDSVNWEKIHSIKGEVVAKESLPTERGDVPTMVVNTENGDRRVWLSAGLRRLFDEAHVGDEVWIAVLGEQDLGKGRKMRTFKAARRQGEAPF